MGTVSCTVCGWLIDLLDEAGLSTERWLRDLDVAPASLHDPRQQLDWDRFAALCERLAAAFGSREELLAATQRCASARFSREAAQLPGSVGDQRQLFWSAQRWLLPSLFPDFAGSYEELADGRLRLVLEIPAEARSCPPLFDMIQGTLGSVPLLIGEPATRVDAEFSERRAVYTVSPSSHRDETSHESEERYRRLAEHFSDIIVEIDDDGRILYASPNSFEMLGYPRSDLVDRCIFDFLHPADRTPDRNRVSEYLGDRESGGKFLRMRHRDGSWRWFHAAVKRAAGLDAETRFIVVGRDVTERKKGENAPRDYHDLLQRIASTTPEILYVFDLEGWRLVFINDAIKAALGVTSADILRAGADFFEEHLHPDDRDEFIEHRRLVRSLTDDGIVEVACRLRHANGEWRWLRFCNRVFSRHADGRVREVLGTANDITEHRRAQEALQMSEERHRIASELASDYSFSVQVSPDRTMVREWITGAFSRITGYAPEEIGEADWERLVHPDDHEERRQQFRNTFVTGRAIHEYRIVRKTGEVRWLREHARVIPAENGSFRWYGACRDITEQKTAESARALTEERFNAMTQSSRDIIAEFDQSGKILYLSPNMSELLGRRPEDFTSARRVDILHPSDAHVVTERLVKMMRDGESEQLIFRIRDGEGKWRWMDTTATAFYTSSGDVRAVMVGRDITDRLEMEEERRQLVSVVENSSEFIAMISTDGSILFLNEAGQKMVGLEGDAAARSRTIFDCLATEDAQDMRFKILPAVDQSGRWEGDFHLRHVKTSKRIATLANVFLVLRRRREQERVLAIVARDISERIMAERRLRESEARHRMLVESAYDLIAEIDLNGCYVYVSPNFDRQLGYAPEQLLGESWFDQLHPEDRATARAAIRDLGGHERRECPPLRIRHRDDSWRWVETNLKKYEDLRGEPLVLALFRDITRRKEAEEALRHSQEQLAQSQKMEAIGRLAGGVAHDFNNLLTAITGYGDLLLESIGDADEVRADAEEIIRAAERAGGLTRQLLAFSRRQVLLPKVLDLNALVADVNRLLRRLIGEDIELVTYLEGELPNVKLDPSQLEQLVINLAVNARDAMPRGGRLTMKTSNLEIGPGGDPSHPGIPPGRHVTLSVQDTGVGMTAQTVSKIFEPFFTTKEAGKGTGLGLAMVYGIVQQSGGEIRVESQPGEGSTFTIYFPQVDEALDPPEPATVHEELRGEETILLVEDSEPVRKLVKRCLEKHGYTVIDAPSSIDALRCAKRHEGEIDLLLTDVVLPKMDGHELAKRLNRLRPQTKVVYMSGFLDDALSRHGLDASDIVLVEKPFAPTALLREVRRRLGEPKSPASAVPAPGAAESEVDEIL